MLTVEDVMTTKIGTVYADSSLREAAELMLAYGVSGIPVLTRAGEVAGILTDADLLRRVELGTDGKAGWLSGFFRPGQNAEDYARSHGRTVDEVMTHGVAVVEKGAPLSEAARLMQLRGVRRLPVMSDGKLVGIVSRMDLLRAVTKLLPDHAVDGTSDAEIRKQFFSALAKQLWAPRAAIGAKVDHGVIVLEGTISDERERTALKVLAENTVGCCGVKDHLICVEPISGSVVDRAVSG